MSKETVKEFYDWLRECLASPEKSQRLRDSLAGKAPTEEAAKKALVETAAGLGFSFTEDDLDAFSRELRESEAGGQRNGQTVCFCTCFGYGNPYSDGSCVCFLGGGGSFKRGDGCVCVGLGFGFE